MVIYSVEWLDDCELKRIFRGNEKVCHYDISELRYEPDLLSTKYISPITFELRKQERFTKFGLGNSPKACRF
jgi:hypothetical protein